MALSCEQLLHLRTPQLRDAPRASPIATPHRIDLKETGIAASASKKGAYYASLKIVAKLALVLGVEPAELPATGQTSQDPLGVTRGNRDRPTTPGDFIPRSPKCASSRKCF